MKIVAYTRVSTDKQAEQGLGLEVQRDAIKAWAKRERHRIALWTSDEGVSGSNGLDSRVGLLDAIGAGPRARSVQGLVVYKLDRLARDLNLQEQLLAEVWRMGRCECEEHSHVKASSCPNWQAGRVFSTSASEDSYLQAE